MTTQRILSSICFLGAITIWHFIEGLQMLPSRGQRKMSSPRMYTEDMNKPGILQSLLKDKLHNGRRAKPIMPPSSSPKLSDQTTATTKIRNTITTDNLHGMPWRHSINEKHTGPLLYMPFWEWHLSFMKRNLPGLTPLPVTARDSTSYPASCYDFSYNENLAKGARIVNHAYCSDHFRKIRTTYYDAGRQCQVFNSLWYPRDGYNLPLLGVDLLAFNGKKYLTIVDYLPVREREEEHSSRYEDAMKEIRDDYPALQGRMSQKFYDENQFFSKQMLFARFEDESVVWEDLFPAFRKYVTAYASIVMGAEEVNDGSERELLVRRQAELDTYTAKRDPAHGLLAAKFGNDWADEFVFGFLFDRSVKDEV